MSSLTSSPTVLSPFTQLRGGLTGAIAPGNRLVTLLGTGATWWEGDVEVTAELPNIPVDGSRWTPDGKSLLVGLGTLDLGARVWRPISSLAAWNQPGPDGARPVKATAWFADGTHVAILIESRGRDGKRSREIVVASVADGHARGRRPVDVVMSMVASDDRLLVAGSKSLLLDLDAKLVAEPAGMPLSVGYVREGGGMFAAVGAAGDVALVRPADGVVLATWDVHANDAVPVPKGIVSVDLQGNVRVGCLEGTAVRTVVEAASGNRAARIQLVGGHIVVAGADGVRVATFTSPCH